MDFQGVKSRKDYSNRQIVLSSDLSHHYSTNYYEKDHSNFYDRNYGDQ